MKRLRSGIRFYRAALESDVLSPDPHLVGYYFLNAVNFSLDACTCVHIYRAMEIPIHTKTREEVLKEFTEVYDARFFKALSEPVRIQILCYLMMNGRSDIGSITESMPQDRSVVSRHLNQMHEVGILNCEKETRHMFYSINGQVFIDKLEGILMQIKKSVSVCCPTACCPK